MAHLPPEWRLREQMNRAGIKSAAELHRRLVETYGTTISAAQVSRLVNGPPERLNLQWLAEVCNLLECSPDDVLTVRQDLPDDGPIQVNDLASLVPSFGVSHIAIMAAQRVERSGSTTAFEKSAAWSLAAIADALYAVAGAIEDSATSKTPPEEPTV